MVNKDEGEKSQRRRKKKTLMGIFFFLFLTNELRCIQLLLVSYTLNYYIEKFYKDGPKMMVKSFKFKIL